MAKLSISYFDHQTHETTHESESSTVSSTLLSHAMGQAVETLRQQAPLALSLTNTVTINFVANAQLSAGAVAAMVTSASEVEDMFRAGAAQGMYMNLGTLQREYETEYPLAAKVANEYHIPWVLDPVGVGAGAVRTSIVNALAPNPPTIIRCNASEAIALAQAWQLEVSQSATQSAHEHHVGVESHDDVDSAIAAACALAQYCHGCVAISGEVDAIVDEQHCYRLHGGSAMMTKVTGAGCSLGGVVASYACIAEPTLAALTASAHYNIASARAQQYAGGPGSFASAFLDELYKVTPQDLVQEAAISAISVDF